MSHYGKRPPIHGRSFQSQSKPKVLFVQRERDLDPVFVREQAKQQGLYLEVAYGVADAKSAISLTRDFDLVLADSAFCSTAQADQLASYINEELELGIPLCVHNRDNVLSIKAALQKPSSKTTSEVVISTPSYAAPIVAPEGSLWFYEKGAPFYEFTNFSPHQIMVDGKLWPTSEHYFQAQKFTDSYLQERVRTARGPRDAFNIVREPGVQHLIRKDWQTYKMDVMRTGLQAKFTQHPILKELLLSTNELILVEHSPYDKYWGDGGDGSGENQLGKLLMELRTWFRFPLPTPASLALETAAASSSAPPLPLIPRPSSKNKAPNADLFPHEHLSQIYAPPVPQPAGPGDHRPPSYAVVSTVSVPAQVESGEEKASCVCPQHPSQQASPMNVPTHQYPRSKPKRPARFEGSFQDTITPVPVMPSVVDASPSSVPLQPSTLIPFTPERFGMSMAQQGLSTWEANSRNFNYRGPTGNSTAFP